MEFPQRLVFDSSDSEDDAAAALKAALGSLGLADPLVVTSVHGKRLASLLGGIQVTPDAGADQAWAAEIGSRAHRSGAGVIVAVGGGRCLDVGKLAAARAGLKLIAAPTQLSHDGICSPIAVVPNESGRAESIGALAPHAVFLSIPTLVGAPAPSLRAGIGDLLANPLSLRDWKLAIDRGLEDPNTDAWELSVESYARIEKYLDEDPAAWVHDVDAVHRLADALILSGTAMIRAGTSRPASGGEHEISHAIDEIFSGRALHGAQVAFGCVVSVSLYGDDTEAFRRRLGRLELPHHPAELGLSLDDVVRILLEAPGTRPGRYTILEAADLDATTARALVSRIWPDLSV
jgi:glycerol-1-phosphate dehydrogenase [NAD(P)+]